MIDQVVVDGYGFGFAAVAKSKLRWILKVGIKTLMKEIAR